ncbi:REF/SRPP-like protein [Senna tora]|uniref:REF/SRPP-like protein n=1 Tax=Senna tora TaxID=362788 RepID=A0A834SK22_9FABA|nr:REF/SRPP-like protein [Senna tora]
MANSNSVSWMVILMMMSFSYSMVDAEGEHELGWRAPANECVGGDHEFEININISVGKHNWKGTEKTNADAYLSYAMLRRDYNLCSYRGTSYYFCRPGAPVNPYQRGCSAITSLTSTLCLAKQARIYAAKTRWRPHFSRQPYPPFLPSFQPSHLPTFFPLSSSYPIKPTHINLHLQVEKKEELKYLEVVQLASNEALTRLSGVYAYAKERSGPLKSSVESVEGTIKTVVGPVYTKYHTVPVEVLKYVDRKVDESVTELDRRLPENVKKVTSEALTAAQKAPEAARTVVWQVRSAGVVDTASGLAKSAYSKCEPKAEQCAVSAWRKLNQLPLFPRVANAVLPTAAYCTEMYNETVRSTAEKGYRVSNYLPLVPTQRIASVFSETENEANTPLPESVPVAGIEAH